MAPTLRKKNDAWTSRGEHHRSRVVTRSNLVFSSLEKIAKQSQVILEKGTLAGFVDKRKDSQEVADLIEELRDAIVYYQVSSGNHARRTDVNTDETDLTAAVDIQSNWEIDRKHVHLPFDPRTHTMLTDCTSLLLTHS